MADPNGGLMIKEFLIFMKMSKKRWVTHHAAKGKSSFLNAINYRITKIKKENLRCSYNIDRVKAANME